MTQEKIIVIWPRRYLLIFPFQKILFEYLHTGWSIIDRSYRKMSSFKFSFTFHGKISLDSIEYLFTFNQEFGPSVVKKERIWAFLSFAIRVRASPHTGARAASTWRLRWRRRCEREAVTGTRRAECAKPQRPRGRRRVALPCTVYLTVTGSR